MTYVVATYLFDVMRVHYDQPHYSSTVALTEWVGVEPLVNTSFGYSEM
jgi:hypothetical protein